MTQKKKEILVGLLVLAVVGLIGLFAWLLGAVSPFSQAVRLQVVYNFAGGVEIGSPVRVAGVKVGKVEKIAFLPSAEAPIELTVSVSSTAMGAVKNDSRFYINMAGIIGERYIEISPGSNGAPPLVAGAKVRGEDPPRIDQLLSQGYGVFGRIHDFLEANEKTIAEFLTQMNHLMTDANKVLKSGDRAKIASLLTNLSDLTVDLRKLTRAMSDEDARLFFKRLEDLVKRAHQVDEPTLKKFLQEEGIRARIF